MRPRDAATLIVIRNNREVLLGKRSREHLFMPDRYVFPGGRVDPGDGRVLSPGRLNPVTEAMLTRDASPHRARGLAMAAIRETWEEAGLVAGYEVAAPLRSRSPHWGPFFDTGYAPAIDHLELVARAVTPPGRVRRFDARFFLIDASHVHGELGGNGELVDLQWVPLPQATELPLAIVTHAVVELLQKRFKNPDAPVPQPIPYHYMRHGKMVLEYL